MENCIFCKIIKNEVPCDKIYEDNDFLAFLTIEPVAPGHLLVIPKEHVVWMQEASDQLIAESFITVKKMMLVLKKAFTADYVSVSIAGKDVPHFHVHLIPRFLNDGLKGWSLGTYKEGESKEIAEKIRRNII